MRRSVKKVLAVLDGQPTGMQGQAMVELVLTLPIFMIMLVGMAEIGWFANNYLILSDVVRSAGRYGSIREPFSYPDAQFVYNLNAHDCEISTTPGTPNETYNFFAGQIPSIENPPAGLPAPPFGPGLENQMVGFYDGVACAVITNMTPLDFNPDTDDIVVSVFSYSPWPLNCDNDSTTPAPDCESIRVSGRWPAGLNECSEDVAGDHHDPFDFNRNGIGDTSNPTETITGDSNHPYYNRFDTAPEIVRGYPFLGNQRIPKTTNCIGSRISLAWMEERLNTSISINTLGLPNAEMSTTELGYVEAYGLVLVEIQWRSEQLLGLFGWVEPIPIHIWGIFPLAAAQPDFDPS